MADRLTRPQIYSIVRVNIAALGRFGIDEIKAQSVLKKVDVFNSNLLARLKDRITATVRTETGGVFDEGAFRSQLQFTTSSRVFNVVDDVRAGIAVAWKPEPAE